MAGCEDRRNRGVRGDFVRGKQVCLPGAARGGMQKKGEPPGDDPTPESRARTLLQLLLRPHPCPFASSVTEGARWLHPRDLATGSYDSGPGSIPAPARFDLDEHSTGVRSCIPTA